MALNVSEKDVLVALQEIHVGKADAAHLSDAHPRVLKAIEILGFMDGEKKLTPAGKAFISTEDWRRRN